MPTDIYVQLGLLFAKLGLLSVGGSSAILADMANELVGRGWLSQREVAQAYAISQLAPGPGGFAPVVLGYAVAGLPGACVAYLSFLVPTVILALVLIESWQRLRTRRWAILFRVAITPIVLGLLSASVLTVARPVLQDPVSIGLGAGALLAIQRTRVPTPLVALGAAVIGAALLRP